MNLNRLSKILILSAALLLLLCSVLSCNGNTDPQESTGGAQSATDDALSSDGLSEDITVITDESEITAEDPFVSTAIGEGTTADVGTTKPAEVTTKPAEVTTKPAEVTTKPAEVTTKPAEVTTKPAEVTTKPSEVTTKEPEVTTKAPEPPTDEPEPSDHIPEKGTLNITMTEIFKIADHKDKNGVHCRVVQGGCTDGTYYYVGLNSGVKTTDSVSAIHKYEIATGKLVKTYENVLASHCNDFVYRADTNELYIVHNQPDREHISVFDPDTLEYKRTITVDHEIYSLAYDPDEQCYWVGISHGSTFAKLDLDFKTVAVYPGYDTGYTKQGMDIDSKYIYFLQYNSNAILVFNKKGEFVRELTLPKTSYEAENIFHIGDTFYIGYYKSSAGGMLYKTEIEVVSEYEASVSAWKEYKTLSQFTDQNSTFYKVAQGSCTDGTYLYVVLSNDNSSDFRAALHKIRLSTGETVAIYEDLRLGQANDLTYNPNTEEILVSTDNPDKTTVIILDAKTMQIKETKHVAFKIYSIAYDQTNNCYWVGISGSYDFAKLDLSLKKVGSTYKGYATGFTKQGSECDGTYFYFVHSAANTLVIYKTDGTFVASIALPTRTSKVQNIACHNGTFYIGYYVENVGCVIYKATVEIEK